MVRRRQLKKVITLQRAMTKKGRQFFKKNRVTPSVAAPGDTNPNDASGPTASVLFPPKLYSPRRQRDAPSNGLMVGRIGKIDSDFHPSLPTFYSVSKSDKFGLDFRHRSPLTVSCLELMNLSET